MKKTLIFLSIILFSCSKPAKVGPAGSTGAQGQQGPIGAQGNANVHSFDYVVSSTDWVKYNTGNGFYTYTIYNSSLTTDISYSGAILVYRGITSGIALPYSVAGIEYTYDFNIGVIHINVYNSNSTTVNPGNITFRIVLINGARKKNSDRKIELK